MPLPTSFQLPEVPGKVSNTTQKSPSEGSRIATGLTRDIASPTHISSSSSSTSFSSDSSSSFSDSEASGTGSQSSSTPRMRSAGKGSNRKSAHRQLRSTREERQRDVNHKLKKSGKRQEIVRRHSWVEGGFGDSSQFSSK